MTWGLLAAFDWGWLFGLGGCLWGGSLLGLRGLWLVDRYLRGVNWLFGWFL